MIIIFNAVIRDTANHPMIIALRVIKSWHSKCKNPFSIIQLKGKSMTTHFTFFESYYESVKELDSEIKAEYYDVLFEYALYDQEPSASASPFVRALFIAIKPNLDKSKARRSAGKTGGSKPKAKAKQSGSKPKAKPKQTPSDTDKDKDKDKEYIKNKQKEYPLLNLEAFERWIKYKGSSYTKQGITLSRNKLMKFSWLEQMGMVENSIMNNYKGLFDPKPITANASDSGNYVDDYFKQQKNSDHEIIDCDPI